MQVTGICFLKQKIIVSGWSRQLAMYRCGCVGVCGCDSVCGVFVVCMRLLRSVLNGFVFSTCYVYITADCYVILSRWWCRNHAGVAHSYTLKLYFEPSCRDTHEFDDVVPKYWGAGVHQDDVLCLSHQEPNLLASGGYDGEIAVWNMDKERPVCRLNASSLTGAGAGGGGWQRQQREEDGDGEGERSGEEKSDGEREAGTRRRRGKDERAVEKVRKYTDIQSH